MQQQRPTYLPESCLVHAGFNASYMSLREQLWVEIMERCSKRGKMRSTPIRFIGHSLGGALATLASFDFHFNADQRSANNYMPSISDSVIKIACRNGILK